MTLLSKYFTLKNSNHNPKAIKKNKDLHPRSKHNGLYDFRALCISFPELSQYVHLNQYNNESIDFFNPKAVKALNTALLAHHYSIQWDIPDTYLCPPIPSRADYIHHIADLLEDSIKINPKNKLIKCLDIGTGANCIYPIIGASEYDWSFIVSDIDSVALNSVASICRNNKILTNKVDYRIQSNAKKFFEGVLTQNEKITLSICNPPFHKSQKEAHEGSLRKLKNLKNDKQSKLVLNFGGQQNELWCKGGEKKFIKDMIFESRRFKKSCLWFTTLVSKESNLNSIYDALKKVEALEVKTINMGHGNKKSRIVAWSFFTTEEQNSWIL